LAEGFEPAAFSTTSATAWSLASALAFELAAEAAGFLPEREREGLFWVLSAATPVSAFSCWMFFFYHVW